MLFYIDIIQNCTMSYIQNNYKINLKQKLFRHETNLTYFSDWQPQQDAVCHFWNFPCAHCIRTFLFWDTFRLYMFTWICFESTMKEHTPCPLKNLRLSCFLIITGTWNIMLCIYGVMMMVCA